MDKGNSAVNFYDSLSASYDSFLEKGYLSSLIRKHLQNELLRTFKKGDCLLDIGCGTGTDAVFLAGQGIRVTALEPSHNMIEAAKQKLNSLNLQGLVDLKEMKGEDIYILKGQMFDGAYSDFDALNHIINLDNFSQNLAAILPSEARVFIVMLNKSCIAEFLFYMIKLKPVLAVKKLFNRKLTFKTEPFLYFPQRVKKFFSADFRTVSVTGFGIFLPPDNFPGFYSRFKLLTSLLGRAEKLISSIFLFYNLCDHYLIELEKK